jgi:hypothetical protein
MKTPKALPVLLALFTGVVLLVVAGLVLLLANRDELSWLRARAGNTDKSYANYLRSRPQGRHAVEAVARQDELSWVAAKFTNTFDGYWRYAQTFPQGRHSDEAQAIISEFVWQQTVNARTPASLENFLKNYGNSPHAPEARARIEELNWQLAAKTNTIRSLGNYLARYPQGRFVAEAKKRQEALRTAPEPFQAAMQKQTDKALQEFLSEYPGHVKQTEAKQALVDFTEGFDIIELLAQKLIAMEAWGNGPQLIKVRLRKLTEAPLTVRIPIGSYFAPDYASVQGMVTTSEGRLRLTSDDWRFVMVSVAAAKLSKNIPSELDSFTIERLRPQSALVELLPVLERAGANYPTRQAAIWIATDNASLNELGKLTIHPSYSLLEDIPVIKETDAARALKLCQEAGLDITQKKIWKKSRQQLLDKLTDPELKKWMEEQP